MKASRIESAAKRRFTASVALVAAGAVVLGTFVVLSLLPSDYEAESAVEPHPVGDEPPGVPAPERAPTPARLDRARQQYLTQLDPQELREALQADFARRVAGYEASSPEAADKAKVQARLRELAHQRGARPLETTED